MRKLVSLLAVGAFCYACSDASEPPQPIEMDCVAPKEETDQTLAAAIDPLVDGAVERGFAGGVSISVKGKIVYSRAAGSSSRKKDMPVTGDTLFHVASISKYFTAALVLKATEEQRIDIDDTIEKHAPGTRMSARGVTYADLLSHRSGLGSSYRAEKTSDPDRAVQLIDAEPLASEPGVFRYSNDGYDVLAVLLERIYGETYETLAREKLFRPLCLARPRFWAEVDITDPAIVGQPLRTVSRGLRKRNYGMIGSAGLLITAQDLAAYQAALVHGSVLTPGSLEALFAPRGDVSIGEATYGAFLSEHPVLGQKLRSLGSEDWGDNAVMAYYPAPDLIVTIVTSRGPAERSGAPMFRDQLLDGIEEVLSARIAEEDSTVRP